MKQRVPRNKARILVVDDDPTTRIMLDAALRSSGYEPVLAATGEEGLEHVERDNFMMIISDWDMPGMSGPELCKRVRGLDLPHYVYFILLTSHTTPERIVEGLSTGADDFIAKPYNPAELDVRIATGMRIVSLDTRDVTIFALAKLAESRDPETGAHLERVRGYARAVARDLQQHDNPDGYIDDEFVGLIYATTPLHDIGKVAIPDSVLLKPGQLTDGEFEVMKRHTIAGADTLAAALEKYPEHRFLQMAHQIARSHHERWDGSGYPDGLEGGFIPLSARIMALADVYDALVSKRVYKNAMAHEVAANIIREGSGSHFDPRLVASFDRLEQTFIEIHHSYNDGDETSANLAA